MAHPSKHVHLQLHHPRIETDRLGRIERRQESLQLLHHCLVAIELVDLANEERMVVVFVMITKRLGDARC